MSDLRRSSDLQRLTTRRHLANRRVDRWNEDVEVIREDLKHYVHDSLIILPPSITSITGSSLDEIAE